MFLTFSFSLPKNYSTLNFLPKNLIKGVILFIMVGNVPQFIVYCYIPLDPCTLILGILRDKTMDDKSIYIPYEYTQNFSFFRSKLLVEKFGH